MDQLFRFRPMEMYSQANCIDASTSMMLVSPPLHYQRLLDSHMDNFHTVNYSHRLDNFPDIRQQSFALQCHNLLRHNLFNVKMLVHVCMNVSIRKNHHCQ